MSGDIWDIIICFFLAREVTRLVKMPPSQPLHKPRKPGRHSRLANFQNQSPVLSRSWVLRARGHRCNRTPHIGIVRSAFQRMRTCRSSLSPRIPDRYTYQADPRRECLVRYHSLALFSLGAVDIPTNHASVPSGLFHTIINSLLRYDNCRSIHLNNFYDFGEVFFAGGWVLKREFRFVKVTRSSRMVLI